MHAVARSRIHISLLAFEAFGIPMRAGSEECRAGIRQFFDSVVAFRSFCIRRRWCGETDRKHFLAVNHQHLVGVDGHFARDCPKRGPEKSRQQKKWQCSGCQSALF